MSEVILNIAKIRWFDFDKKHMRMEFHLEKVCAKEKKRIVLWYLFEKEFESYLCIDRCDAVIITLFFAAMKYGYTKICSKYPISKKLYYNLSYHIIPQLYAIDKRSLSRLKLEIPLIDSCFCGDRVATGMSRGVDSFATLYEYGKRCNLDGYRLNLLTYFQVGAHHGYDETMGHSKESRQELFEHQMEKTREFCKQEGYPLLVVETNVDDVLEHSDLFREHSFDRTHTFRNLGIATLFQRGIHRYYYSSTYNLTDFKFKIEGDIAYSEKWFIPLLSTGSIEFYSANQEWTRMEKVEKISQMKECYNYLQVCLVKSGNCGGCMKCKRTLLELDALGDDVLEKWGGSFNLATYKEEKRNKWFSSLADDKDKNMNEAHYYDEVLLCASKYHPELLGNMIQSVETDIKNVVVQYDLINIRELPSFKAPILDVAKKEDVFPYIGNYGSWVAIDLKNGRRAYLIRKGVTLTKDTVKALNIESGGKCKICWERVNLRDLPNRNSKIVGFGEAGNVFVLHRDLGSWVSVDLNDGTIAYVVKDAVELDRY
ncbi:SH3 domain-containing protein [Butyrivibrio sp. AE2005]|uniref:SH3 domain-containing protein n=1 Tax=Butyrivibrio sp. AE2005 TaxID=1496722 RepID=UPI00047A64BE|nr:hypothetical protein [Butyrivibrio sp. AE2005]